MRAFIRGSLSGGAVIFFLILSLVALHLPVYALTVEPSVFDISLLPGGETDIKLAVTNPQRASQSIRIEIADLTYTPEGLPQFSVTGRGADSIISWITAENKTETVGSGKVLTLPFRIRVPAGTAPGGHYGAVLVSGEAEVTAGNPADIGVVPKVAALLYLEVAGQVKRDFKVAAFAAERKFFTSFPVTFSLNLRNTGTVHLVPHGVVSITHAWSKVTRGALIVNEDSAYILPGKTRRFSLVWQESDTRFLDPRWWGPYRAEVLLVAAGAKRQTASTQFWILPFKYMFPEIGSAVLLLILLNRFVRRITSRYGKRK